MGTTEEKLQAIISAKADIGAAITEKGGEVPQKFSGYGDAIRALPSGGTDTPIPLDAKKVYDTIRSSLWPPMPAFEDDTLYLLLQIPTTVESAKISFTVKCTGNYAVQVGVYTETGFIYGEEEEFPSNTQYKKEIFYSETEPAHIAIVKIKGDTITSFVSNKHDDSEYYLPCVVEFSGMATNITIFKMERSKDLKFATLYGTNKIKQALNNFYSCEELKAVVEFDTSNALLINSIYGECKNLLCVPPLSINPNIVTFTSLCKGCKSLAVAPTLSTSNKAIPQLFHSCTALQYFDLKDTVCPSMASLFYGCVSLNTILNLHLEVITSRGLSGTFNNCLSLRKLTFASTDVSVPGEDFSLQNCAFDRTGLVEMFRSLPAIAESHSITITGNPGVAELTDEDKAIATAKNWTLVL